MNSGFLRNRFLPVIGFSFLALSASVAHAAYPYDFWATEGWTQFADDQGGAYGGQAFDTEYFYYKYDEATKDVSIGLQTGFDVVDGKQRYGNKNYYGGDLALSFDGNDSSYEYAVDFGLKTKDWNDHEVDAGSGTGIDAAGLYQVTDWNNNVYHAESSPFAMTDGSLLQGITFGQDGNTRGQSGNSYYTTVTFNVASIVDTAEDFTVDSHWTMSCGNDHINGNFMVAGVSGNVPEPSILALFGIGSIGMGFAGYRRRKSKA